ncbi:hypothetical protein [Nonomuraea endophytica]|uniref:Cytochrome P450 n=1 Tax=Nonomuraea endophytica TaxID=714136 RepID=A0A7W8AAZ2_9ACTN|nr:hypothetical protein [Nonomuraea endophytica]MBB5082324.1 cytochrome P450 [Nonomuraea endophytica]
MPSEGLTERRVERPRPVIHEIADDLLTRLLAAGSPAELVTGFELLGVPREDLLSSPAAAREDLLSLGTHLITAGHESTAASLTSAILVLLCHPGGITFLNSCPAAVEELLRFDPLARSRSHMRVATEDTEIAGVPLGKARRSSRRTTTRRNSPIPIT